MAAAEDEGKTGLNRFEALEQSIEQFIETTRQIGIIVSDFQTGSQGVLNQKITSVVENLREIEKCKDDFQNVEVPMDVFSYIDEGKNPQLYTKDCLEKALAQNKEVKGKIDSYKNFKTELMSELSKEFPKEMLEYRNYVEDSQEDR
ncbi:mediator of RNA polymerase II transcription subunit 10-like [Dendronephthya gigantea]|uniref:mediator of RNA polymerase II transcription subunit 10-like n=1 Tax=Dendronephthya gigantea TaxID=151771 RepID=UPI00106BE987|nr:mediator of RNA polymerase II transcription subunit 10-like [Dendronephthya gigantea]